MGERELIDALRRRLDQPGSNITLGRVKEASHETDLI